VRKIGHEQTHGGFDGSPPPEAVLPLLREADQLSEYSAIKTESPRVRGDSNVEVSDLRGISRMSARLPRYKGKLTSPLSFTFLGIARFARFEGWCIPWGGFVIAAALIRLSC
jgi:hypothetical protein